jgi:hypothetical protein
LENTLPPGGGGYHPKSFVGKYVKGKRKNGKEKRKKEKKSEWYVKG